MTVIYYEYSRCKDLNETILQNAARVKAAIKLTTEDSTTIAILRKEVDKAWKLVEQAKNNEEKARKIISDLKRSGEQSVDSLMSTLGHHKTQQEVLDREIDSIRAVINAKEHEVNIKEGDITNLNRLIELETNEKQIEIRRLKTEIDE